MIVVTFRTGCSQQSSTQTCLSSADTPSRIVLRGERVGHDDLHPVALLEVDSLDSRVHYVIVAPCEIREYHCLSPFVSI